MSAGTGLRNLCVALALSLSLAGCLGNSKSSPGTNAGNGGTSGNPPATPTNRAPTISGTPITTAKTNQAYAFVPSASDPDGDAITFAVFNKPSWASFDAKSGRLAGTPSSSSTGLFADIRIVASDGVAKSTLGPFSITVASTAATGSATLSWQPPTENVDGSPLTNLAGYVIRYGTKAAALDNELRVPNPGITTSIVEGLAPATWYFSLSAYNSVGVESTPSAMGSKTIT